MRNARRLIGPSVRHGRYVRTSFYIFNEFGRSVRTSWYGDRLVRIGRVFTSPPEARAHGRGHGVYHHAARRSLSRDNRSLPHGGPRFEERSRRGGRSDSLRPLDQTRHHNKGRVISTRDARTDKTRTADVEWGGMRNARRTAESHCTKERPVMVPTARHDHAVLSDHR